MGWKASPKAKMIIPSPMMAALMARRINQVFGTSYGAAELDKLEDAHIAELLNAADILEPPKEERVDRGTSEDF